MKFGSLMFDGRGLNEILARPFGVNLIACCVFLSLAATRPAAQAEPLQEARVSHVIKDVRLLATNAAPRPASVNDDVRQGTAVRTGADSRAELTFSDLTITRIGQNTVFSFKGGSREVTLDSGAILLQVPKGAEAAKIRTAGVTASITGGTALMNANSGYPTKLYIMEGAGELCLNSGECVTAHGGEMVMEDNGQLTKPVKFNAKLMFKTSPLLTGFPPLPNESLFFETFNEPGDDSSPPPHKEPIDIISERGTPPPGPPGPTESPGKFGPLSTISSPDPYVISSGTQINTDPMITTNGVTDQGKLYRGTAVDGFPTQYLFGEAPTAFDQMVFAGPQNNLPIAIFKFANLQLTGDPTVTIPSGATTFLGLVSVGDITSGGPGGTLTFAGITRLSMITQAGSITLGPEIGFANLSHLEMYARGAGSNLTLGSAISNVDAVKLYAGGSIQVNGDVSTMDFNALSEGDFLAGSGVVTTTNVTIQSLANVNIDASKYPDFTGDATFTAGDTLSITLTGGGGAFSGSSLTGTGTTINLQGSGGPTTFDFSNSSSVTFTAGTGGINAPNIDFVGSPPGGLSFLSGGSISIHSLNTEDATISAATSFTASGDVTGAAIGSTLTAGTTVDVGGDLFVITLTAGGNINVGNNFIALNVNAPSSILTVQGNIGPFGGEGLLQYTYNVDSIIAPAGINFSFNGTPDFVGKLTINANTLTFDPATGVAFANFNGVNAGEFGAGSPPEGGDGGTFIVNANGNITANNGADITATTGINTDAGVYSGAGGSVTLHSSGGTVTVNDTIQVSSDDGPNQRQSASGGTILLQSDLTAGPGITVGGSAQLLSLLNANASGPGGSITLSTMGADITVSPGAVIQADRGTITMDQSDPVGPPPGITIDGATLISANLNISSPGNISIGNSTPVTINAGAISLLVNNPVTGDLGTGGSIIFNPAGNLDVATGDLSLTVDTSNGGHADSDAMISVTASNISTGGTLFANIFTQTGNIGGSAGVNFTLTGNLTTGGDANFTIDNGFLGTGIGTIGADAMINVIAANISTSGSLTFNIYNSNGSTIGADSAINVSANSISTGGDFFANLENSTAGIGGNATISVTATNIATGGQFFAGIDGIQGTIGLDADINLNLTGDLTTHANAGFTITDGNGGSIGADATITVSAANISPGGSLSANILNESEGFMGGHIVGNANITFNLTGDLMAPSGDLNFSINNSGGTIGGNATISVSAANISFGSGGLFATIENYNSGSIGGIATINFGVTGALTSASDAFFLIDNNNGGTIGSDATMNVSASNISTGGNLDVEIDNIGGTITGSDATININAGSISTAGSLLAGIFNHGGGAIAGSALINVGVSGDINTQSDASFEIYNFNDNAGGGAGIIGSDATINVSAANISFGSGGLFATIENYNSGSIGGIATINFGVTGALTSASDAFFLIDNNNGGTIGSDATMNVSASNISTGGNLDVEIDNIGGTITGKAMVQIGTTGLVSANSFTAQILNSTGGSIGGDATINMNVSGTATVTNDATVQILGNDPAGSAAINFNGGSYDVGGTFLSRIDGDGAITFTNTSVHADIVKAGVFGTNGTLTVGGGTLSADTVLKLYAPGSNGTLDFNASVTLSSGTAMHLAANTITIEPGFTVTIAGAGGPANIYTEHPNYNFTPGGGYMGPPGNPANGSFGGNGALDPVPLASAPGFGAPAISSSSIGNPVSPLAAKSGTPLDGAINISSTGQLLSLLDTAVTGPGGKVTIPGPNSARNSGRPGRIYAESDLEVDRGARQTTSSATGKVTYAGANNPQPLNHAPPVGPPGI